MHGDYACKRHLTKSISTKEKLWNKEDSVHLLIQWDKYGLPRCLFICIVWINLFNIPYISPAIRITRVVITMMCVCFFVYFITHWNKFQYKWMNVNIFSMKTFVDLRYRSYWFSSYKIYFDMVVLWLFLWFQRRLLITNLQVFVLMLLRSYLVIW